MKLEVTTTIDRPVSLVTSTRCATSRTISAGTSASNWRRSRMDPSEWTRSYNATSPASAAPPGDPWSDPVRTREVDAARDPGRTDDHRRLGLRLAVGTERNQADAGRRVPRRGPKTSRPDGAKRLQHRASRRVGCDGVGQRDRPAPAVFACTDGSRVFESGSSTRGRATETREGAARHYSIRVVPAGWVRDWGSTEQPTPVVYPSGEGSL